MLISIREFYDACGRTRDFDALTDTHDFEYLGTTYPILSGSSVILMVSSPKKREVKLHLEGKVLFDVPCGRCLEPVRTVVKIDNEIIPDEGTSDTEPEWNSYLNGYDLDVDRMVYEEILLGFPMKVLCKEDCKGICPVCGADRNKEECGCDITEPDPRMSVIRELFNNVKEV